MSFKFIEIFSFMILFLLVLNSNICFSTNTVNYQDSIVTLESNLAKKNLTSQIEYANSGSVIVFGKYEQDGILENGKEPLQWILLGKNDLDRSAIIITAYIIDCIRFNGFHQYATWDNSSLRNYMNNEMIYKMFNDEERACIKPTELFNAPNLFYGSYSGEPTVDSIYIPSIDDMFKFFSNNNYYNEAKVLELLKPNINRTAKATQYAIMKGVRVMDKDSKYHLCGNYFLRTTGLQGHRIWYNNVYADFFQSYVTELGEVKPDGTGVNSCDDGIRVMMQVFY